MIFTIVISEPSFLYEPITFSLPLTIAHIRIVTDVIYNIVLNCIRYLPHSFRIISFVTFYQQKKYTICHNLIICMTVFVEPSFLYKLHHIFFINNNRTCQNCDKSCGTKFHTRLSQIA